MASREVRIFFFSIIFFFFYKLKCKGGKVKKKDFFLNMKKKFLSALLDPPGPYTRSNFLYKGGPKTDQLMGRDLRHFPNYALYIL